MARISGSSHESSRENRGTKDQRGIGKGGTRQSPRPGRTIEPRRRQPRPGRPPNGLQGVKERRLSTARDRAQKRNQTNGNSKDGTINGYSFQAKFVSVNSETRLTYQVNFTKNSGRIADKYIKKNYEYEDFRFFIVEVGGTEEFPDKYIGNFCIIPREIIKDEFRSEDNEGKKSVYVCPPDYSREHWSKVFWNNISNIPPSDN